jgi:hypothetical protein
MHEEVYQLLSDLRTEASNVRAAFDDLFDPHLDTVPIPFFGDIANARVLTVGLNPSDGELRGRGWPRPVDTPTLYDRLTRYFDNPQFSPHPWFATWIQALGEIGVSYAEGTVAHIDLSPWPTRPMSSQADPDRFASLVRQGVSCFERCIQIAAEANLILIAGAVTKKHYLNEFLAKALVGSNMALIGKVVRGGSAFVGFQQLRTVDREIPVFFCSVSPSSRTSDLLPTRVREHRDRLIPLVCAPATPPN